MDFDQFKEKIIKALNELYDIDRILLDKRYNVNERTITHRLALHMTPLFKDFDVDCEYNRMTMTADGTYTEGDYWVKSINLSRGEYISESDDEAKTVFPDIIIHKRRRLVNLAVIEIKMKWKNGKKDFDKKKLTAYKKDLKYEYAVYIELGEREFLLEINEVY